MLDFKQDFFHANDSKLEEFKEIALVYRAQSPRRTCKNCSHLLDFSPRNCFINLGVEYTFCARCGHCNGRYEDSDDFCRTLYTGDRGSRYAKNYSVADAQQYERRVAEIYLPKASFLRDALTEAGADVTALSDFGAGAGYFMVAAKQCGFSQVTGYEPSETMVNMGVAMMKDQSLHPMEMSNMVSTIRECESPVVSFIGVLEHIQSSREVLQAICDNDRIQYIFFSVPLFSQSVVLESIFTEIMPRHLVSGNGHTHLYTEQSIQHFCNEFGFQRLSEWWFGLDITDLYRSVLISLDKANPQSSILSTYWNQSFRPLIDGLQRVLDEAKCCSEVHMVLGKTPR